MNILVPGCDVNVAVPSLPQRGQSFSRVKGTGKAASPISELQDNKYVEYKINSNLPSLLLLDIGSK